MGSSRPSQRAVIFPILRNIAVTVPDDVDRNARIRAAERGTSVSALAGEYLHSLSGQETEFSRLEAR
jgi:plasmid stability protein